MCIFIVALRTGADIGRQVLPVGIGGEELGIGLLESWMSLLLAITLQASYDRALLTVDQDDVLLVEALTSEGSNSIGNGVPGEAVGVMNGTMVVELYLRVNLGL